MQLLDSNTSSGYISRLENLDSTTIPNWGKMNATQMLAHCRIAMELPLGKIEVKTNFIFKLLFGKMIKKKVTDDSIYKPSLPTAAEFVIKEPNLNFEEEKSKLITTINQFCNLKNDVLSNKIHPIFGKMTNEEWRISQWKHLDHHWRQFGI
jgi:hypothetical protein